VRKSDVHDYNKVICRADHNLEWRITISLCEILVCHVRIENKKTMQDTVIVTREL